MVYGNATTVVYTVSFLGHTEVLEGFQVFNILSNSSNKKGCVLCIHACVYVEVSGIWRTLLFPTEKACTFSKLGLGWAMAKSFISSQL